MQYPSQAMAAFQPGMVPTGQQQQVAAGMASQPHMAMQQQHGSQQQIRQAGMQQPGYTPGSGSGSGVYAQQVGMQQQAGMAQYPSSTADQGSRPMSPPGLPFGPSQPATASQRSQIKSPSGQFLGPQMIRPATATNPMMAHQMAGNQMAGNQMAGHHMAGHHMMTGQMAGSQVTGSRMAGNHLAAKQVAGNTASLPKSPSAQQSAYLQSAAGPASNAMSLAAAHSQVGPQPSNSASSRPNSASSRPGSASSQEGIAGSDQSQGALVPLGRAGAGQAAAASQAAVRYPSGQGGLHMQQAGYGPSAYGTSWGAAPQAGMNRYPGGSQSGMMHGEAPLCSAICRRMLTTHFFW